MKILTRLLNRIFGLTFDGMDMDEEYCERFMKPKTEHARALGIPEDEIDHMWRKAFKDADPLIVGQAPGSLFANMVDAWEADNTDTSK